MSVELTETLLKEAAGWEAMKMARAYLAQGQVLSSFWKPPLLRGVVQTGDATFRASMVIEGRIDIENLCHCRDARQWGKICAHSVAVGLHWLKAQQPDAPPKAPRSIASVPPPDKIKGSAVGLSIGVGWQGQVTPSTLYNIDLKINQFDFQDDVVAGGVDLSYEENFSTF